MSATLKFGAGEWATKKGSTLAYNSENGNFKPLPFTFDRAGSATRVNKQGLIEVVSNNEPRIDFLNDSKGALLLEPSRSNFIIYSQDFSNAVWNTGATRSVNFAPTSTIDPQGKTNAYRVTSTASDNQVAVIGSIVSGQIYTNSIYVRRVSGNGNVALRNVNNEENIFEVSVNDGWKRIETSATSTSTFGRLYINLKTVGDVIEIWGGQLEQGSYATSYIPTQGSIGTRVAESCSNGGNGQVINSTEGVFYVEAAKTNESEVEGGIFLSRDRDNEIRMNFATNNRLNVFVNVGGSYQVYMDNTNYNLEEYNKIAIKYKLNDYSVFVNGNKILTDTNATVPSGLNLVDFNQFYGNVKEIKLYNEALTDAELAALTS
ncbi:LamG-like jellyroll fold domain-containing protein [uncultured Polaribacter sp.]|uniref:phage head spike fiber domain-containing protein n=1 Tax=uncultured Polaribacter sp. TaxID=174711 RepID=UPI00259B51C5|nr:LamG-like jellyroll fold domain-containing protein [uncultured Polaribacter sp.]